MNNLKKCSKLKNTHSLDSHQLSVHEIIILDKSEEDLKHGRVISQEDLDKEDLEWLSK